MTPKNRIQEVYMELEKIPPQAIDLEEALIGTLLNTGAYQFAYRNVTSIMFYKEAHRLIYEVMESLANRKEPIDTLTVINELRRLNKLDMVGGPYFLNQLADKAFFSPHKIEFYSRIIHQTFISREIIRISIDAQKEAFDKSADIVDTIDKVLKEVRKLYKSNFLDIPKILTYEKIIIKKMMQDPIAFTHIRSTIPENFFIDRIHTIIWNTMNMLTENNIEVNTDSVEDILYESKNDRYIPYFQELLAEEYPSEENYEYIFTYLKRYYDRVQIVKIYDYLEENKGFKEPEEIVKHIDNLLDNIRAKDIEIKKFSIWLDKTFMKLTEQALTGYQFLKTGYSKLDRVAALTPNSIILVGGATGIGKTRFITHLGYCLLKNNKDVVLCGVFMEDSIDKINRVLFSDDTKLSSDQMVSKNYVLTEEDKIKLKDAYAKLKKVGADIDIVDDVLSIRQIETLFVKFSKKHPGKQCVFILDNLMQIQDNDGKTATDDMIARIINRIVKKTGGTLFMLHHFTKEQKQMANAIDGYRPREEHLKGSTRYTDVSTHVWLLNAPHKYPDLIRDQTKRLPILIDGKEFSRKKILKSLLVTEFTKIRDGTNDESERVIRFFCDFDKMKIKEWR